MWFGYGVGSLVGFTRGGGLYLAAPIESALNGGSLDRLLLSLSPREAMEPVPAAGADQNPTGFIGGSDYPMPPSRSKGSGDAENLHHCPLSAWSASPTGSGHAGIVINARAVRVAADTQSVRTARQLTQGVDRITRPPRRLARTGRGNRPRQRSCAVARADRMRSGSR